MFPKPSLITRIAVGKAIGLAVGLAGLILMPYFPPLVLKASDYFLFPWVNNRSVYNCHHHRTKTLSTGKKILYVLFSWKNYNMNKKIIYQQFIDGKYIF